MKEREQSRFFNFPSIFFQTDRTQKERMGQIYTDLSSDKWNAERADGTDLHRFFSLSSGHRKSGWDRFIQIFGRFLQML